MHSACDISWLLFLVHMNVYFANLGSAKQRIQYDKPPPTLTDTICQFGCVKSPVETVHVTANRCGVTILQSF
jgi:hypothetical protein